MAFRLQDCTNRYRVKGVACNRIEGVRDNDVEGVAHNHVVGVVYNYVGEAENKIKDI